MADWDEIKAKQDFQRQQAERARSWQEAQKEKDRALREERDTERQSHQLSTIERRHELARLNDQAKVEANMQLQALLHSLEPEQLARLQQDYAFKSGVDAKALVEQIQAETVSRREVIESQGVEERSGIRSQLRARITEMLLEHSLRLRDREHAFGFEQKVREFEASLRQEIGAPINPEEAAQIDAFIADQVQRNFGANGFRQDQF